MTVPTSVAVTASANPVAIGISDTLTATLTANTDTHTISLVHFDGSNGSNVFPDAAPGGMSIPPGALWEIQAGTPELDTSTYAFGGASYSSTGGAYLRAPSSYIAPNISIAMAGGAFTIEGFLNPAGVTTANFFFSQQSSAHAGTSGYLDINSNLNLEFHTAANAYTMTTTGNLCTVGTWRHWAFQYDGVDTYTLYFNGILSDTVVDSNAFVTNSGAFLTIGSATVFGPASWNGHIDECRVSNVVRYTGSTYTIPTAEFPAPYPGSTPTGTVQFYDGAGAIGSPATVSSYTADIPWTFATAGVHAITAVYGGDGNYSTGTSPIYDVTATGGATSTTLVAASNPVSVGTPDILTAVVSGASPTGSVSFYSGATLLDTSALVSGVATLLFTFAAVGPLSLTAVYSGDTYNAPSTSAPYSLDVISGIVAPTTTTLTADINPVSVGTPDLLTATVIGVSPTGTVQFLDDGVVINIATLIGDTATFAYTFSSTGLHVLSAVYTGDTNNGPSSTTDDVIVGVLVAFVGADISKYLALITHEYNHSYSTGVTPPPPPVSPPSAPLSVSATAGNAQAIVAFDAPLISGGAAVTGYTVVSSPPGGVDTNAGSVSLVHTVTGLTNGVLYTFTASATNSAGTGPASLPSAGVTPYAITVPGAPLSISATAGNSSAVVTMTAPASNGGSPILGYTVTSLPAGGIDTNAGSPSLSHAIIGLTDGVSYTFTGTATNAIGTGAPSAASNSVTPTAPSSLYDGVIAVSSAGLLVNGAGTPIMLRGGNMPMDSQIMGSWPTQPYGVYAGAGGPPWATYASWKPNVVRITINVGAWLNLNMGVLTGTPSAPTWTGAQVAGDPSLTYKAAIVAMILAARAIGCYVIINCHWAAPSFTFSSVTNYMGAFGQPMFMDTATCLPYWTAAVGAGPTDSTGNPSTGIVAYLQQQFGPGGPYNNALYGGSTGIGDIIFELFNEPFLNGQTVNYNSANLGAGSALTESQIMLSGGWVSGYSNQFSGTGRGGTGCPTSLCGPSGQPNTTTDAYTFNYWWEACGYQQVLTGIRTLGATNVCTIGGDTWSNNQSQIPAVYPTDSLSPPQVGTHWHAYSTNNTDMGSTAATTANYSGTSGIGHAIPVIVSEYGNYSTGSGPGAPQPDVCMTTMQSYFDAAPTGAIGGTSWEWPPLAGSPAATVQMENTLGTSTVFTASFSGTTMTVTAGTGIQVGMVLVSGAADRTVVTGLITGSGGVGTYTVSIAQAAGSSSVTGCMWVPNNGQGLTHYNWMVAHAP